MICRRRGCPNSPCWKFHPGAFPSKSLIWLRPQYDWSCCCFVIFVPQNRLGGLRFFPRGRFRFIWCESFGFLEYSIYQEAHCFGKAIPLPHSEWGQPPTVEFHEVGLCVAPGLSCGRAGCWKPMAGSRTVCCHDQGVAFRGKGHPTLNRKSL